MEARDTVMKFEERRKFGVWNGRKRLAEAQAEISFRLGKQEGIREIVKTLNMIDKEAYDTRDFTRRVCDLLVEYETQLKERGN